MNKDIIESVDFELHDEQYEARLYHPDGKETSVYGDIVYKGTETNPEKKMRPIVREWLSIHGIETDESENTHTVVRKLIAFRRGGR